MINGAVLLVLTILSLNSYATAQVEGDLRLADGLTNTSGRVEIFHDGNWGTVCNDHFADRDTQVVCRQLGFRNRKPLVWRDVPDGTGLILLDDLGCVGTEATLAECRHQPWGQHNCAHRDDVGVECDTESFVNAMQLVGGTPRSGLLYVHYGETWGPVCSARFGNNDAKVACKTLGFAGDGAQMSSVYGGTTQEPLLANVNCDGDEKTMSECTYIGPFNVARYCWRGAHVALSCMGPGIINATHVTARLNGGSEVSGRLELSVDGIWGSVCNDGFDNTAAKVACRMLGLPTEHSIVYSFSLTHQNLPIVAIWLDDVQCNGTEQSIVDCGHKDWMEHNCDHSEDVGVFCTEICATVLVRLMLLYSRASTDSTYITGIRFSRMHETYVPSAAAAAAENRRIVYVLADPHVGHHHEIRLAGSNDTNSGRVEVSYYGIWGTVCDDRWRESNSQVICRSLNLPFENARLMNADAFGPGGGPTWLDEVRCGGEEDSLYDCQHAPLGIENCDHSEDVAVICEW